MTAFKKVKKIDKHSTGSKIIITNELIEKVCNCLRAGSYIETACIISGISKTTLYDWLKKANANPSSKYGLFANAVEKAMAEAEIRDLLVIDKTANGQDWEYERDESGRLVLNGRGNPIPKKIGMAPNWQASAWRLERRNPSRWGRQDRPESENDKSDDTIKIEFVDAEKK